MIPLCFDKAADVAVGAIEAATGGDAYFVDNVASTFFADVLRELDTPVGIMARRDDAHTQASTFAEAFKHNAVAGVGGVFERGWDAIPNVGSSSENEKTSREKKVKPHQCS